MLLNRGKKAKIQLYNHNNFIKANINYSLTSTQQKASNQVLNYVKSNKNVIINAVCGAGKTELVYKSIEYMLNNNKIVGFAIPRKDVVIEIYNRLKKDYPSIDIACVYGGHTDKIDAQLVVLTTHQLFRYNSYFDLLILDEADAFPYKGNNMLENFLKDSVKGPIVYLSATVSNSISKNCKNVVYVNRRYHNYDLPIPKVIKVNLINKYKVINRIIDSLKTKPILIFVPTIKEGIILQSKINVPFIYSSYKDKNRLIEEFKDNKIKRLITTSILERGVTFKDVQVIVFNACNSMFDEATLVQISGRVGRKIDAPKGNIYFLANRKSDSIKKCIKKLKEKNLATV